MTRAESHSAAARKLLRQAEPPLCAYQGTSAVSNDHFQHYLRNIRRPGYLRAGIAYYAAVWQDARDNAALEDRPLAVPVLALGGEAAFGRGIGDYWSPVATDLTVDVVPRAGHWLGDENPRAVAERVAAFFRGE